MAVFLAKIVIPLSRSSGFESKMVVCCISASFSRKVCDCLSIKSTRVVLP